MRLLALLLLSSCAAPVTTAPDAEVDVEEDAGRDAGDTCLPSLTTGELQRWVVVGAAQGATDTTLPVVAQGGRVEVALRRLSCCYFFEAPEPIVCPTWRVVSPVDAAFTSFSGARATLTVGAVPSGSVIELEARVGSSVVRGAVAVAFADSAPLAGTWHEVERFACDGGALPSYQPVNELVLTADGAFQVTWVPFERYVDFWGTWTLGPGSALSLRRTGGNVEPVNFDGDGRWALDAGKLIFSDLFLGTSGPGERACTQVFAR
ncbi:MAG: hypothetical protein ACOZQL_34700 [Myxococcota bacterium]